jgi:cell division protein FtsQ
MGLFDANKLFTGKKSGATPARRTRDNGRTGGDNGSRSRASEFTERARIERQQRAEQEERDSRAAVQKRQEQLRQQQKKEEQQRRSEKTEKSKKVKAEREPLPWANWGLKLMPVLALSLVAALLIAGWKLLDHVGSVPVSRVVFTGNLQHVDRKEMVEKVQPLLVGAGFMTVDIDAIRASLREIPWIASASVARSWPDQLIISVSEQDPIARWGDVGLLSRSGDVFRPQPLGKVGELPALFGPDTLAKEVVSHYAELSDLLASQGLKLASLGTDERGSWRAELQGGVSLRLGSGDLLKKTRRFLRIYRDDLAPQFARVHYVDLRYSNGLAVGWKTES